MSGENQKQQPVVIAQIMGKWVGGGVEAVIMNYYRHIDRTKVQFDFICDEDSTNIPYDEIEKLGGNVIICPPYQKISKYMKFLEKLFREKKYRIVHSNINTLSVFPLKAAKKAGVPVRIAHSHSTGNPREWKKNILKTILRPFSKRYATDYFACGELAGKYLFGKKAFKNGKVTIIPNAIDVEKFKYDPEARKKLRKEIGIKEDDFVIGHIGRFVEQKNHRFLIDMFAEVKKEKKNAKLVLVGQGPLEEGIREKIKSLNLEKDVFFLGQRNDTNKLYSVFDIFCLPSLYEGLPVVGVEAQANGVEALFSDRITAEAITNNAAKRISIKTVNEWVETIDSCNKKDRFSNSIADIEESVKKLLGFYMERSKKKIIITNAYRWRNKGDAGILLGIVEVLKKVYGEKNVDISVLSFTPEEDSRHYLEDPCVNYVGSNLINPNPYKCTKIGKTAAILKVIRQMIKYGLGVHICKKCLVNKSIPLKHISESDMIVVCGGGFLGGKKLDSLMHLAQISIDVSFGRPVVVLGASVEPSMNCVVSSCTKRVLKKCTHIVAREKITYELLRGFIDNDKLSLCPDMAFMLKNPEVKHVKNKIVRLGVTVRKWDFPGAKHPGEKMDNYLNAMAGALDMIIDALHAEVFFIPQVIVEHGNDAKVAKIIKEKMRNSDKFLVSEEDLTPLEIKRMIGAMDVFLGTRMHSNIFATSMGIPTVAIAYEKKTNGIMQTIGLDDYVLEIDNINQKIILEKVLKAYRNKKTINKKLSWSIKDIRKQIIGISSTVLRSID